MRLSFEVVSIQHNARTRHGDEGPIREEVVTVVMMPTHPGGQVDHPNFPVWQTRVVFGEVRLADLPAAEAAYFRLHARYAVDITEEV
jgi:hypothetical protein